MFMSMVRPDEPIFSVSAPMLGSQAMSIGALCERR
jgi:hypothetical protein